MRNQRRKKRVIFVSLIFLIALLALSLIIFNFRSNIVFFYSPTEVKNLEITKKNRSRIRIGGLVKENSVEKIDALTTEFVVTDLNEELKIRYVGLLPNMFRDKQGVVAQGKFDEEKNEFLASELLIKHDENYMPPEVANALKR